MADELVERVARAMAENAGFAWENCTQPQWKSDARAGIKAMVEGFTDDMLLAAVRAMEPDRIQGFSTPLNQQRTSWGPPHYIRDVWLPPDKQELWRGVSRDEMLERCDVERLRIGLRAALTGNREGD